MKTPLVTIITVTYNSSEFVREAIDSILASTYTNFELIIGDDYSNDQTWEIINEYTDKRILKYQNEINIGEYPNRNKAIGMAKGEYLLFIDGDDMIYPHGLDFMVKMIEAFPRTGMAIMQKHRDYLFYPVVITPKEFYYDSFFGDGFQNIAFTNTFFKRDVLIEVGGLSEIYKAGDNIIRWKIAKEYDTLIISNQHTWWRVTSGQASQKLNDSSNGLIENYKMTNEVLGFNDNPLSTNDILVAKKNLKIQVARILIKKMIKFEFSYCISVLKSINFNLLDFRFYFFRSIKKDSITNLYSSVNPKKSDFIDEY